MHILCVISIRHMKKPRPISLNPNPIRIATAFIGLGLTRCQRRLG